MMSSEEDRDESSLSCIAHNEPFRLDGPAAGVIAYQEFIFTVRKNERDPT